MPELDPGMTKRRWTPEGGVQRHNERIHHDSRLVDHHKNLPFTFSKPTRAKKSKLVECTNCGYTTSVSKNTVGMICHRCKKYVTVKGVVKDD